jgi:hypothetical protein
MHKLDLASIVSIVIGVSALAGAGPFVDALTNLIGPAGAKAVDSFLVIVGLIAPVVMRIISNPSPPSGTVSVVAPANAPPTPANLATTKDPGTPGVSLTL